MHLTIADLHDALEKSGYILRSASGQDKFISQKDIEEKLNQLEGAERAVVAALYQLLREYKNDSAARITWTDLQKALPLFKDRIITQFSLAGKPLSAEARLKISSLLSSAPLAAESLLDYALDLTTPSPSNLAAELGVLAKNLDPAGYHVGEYQTFESVYFSAQIDQLTAENFLALAQNQHPDGSYRVERIVEADREFFLGLTERQSPANQINAFKMIRRMRSFLDQRALILLELEGVAWRPLYVVGLMESDIVGVRTSVKWR